MRFIRENLFLLILIGIVVVLGGVIIAINFSIGGDVEDRIKDRQNLSKSLQGLVGPAKYNLGIVEAEKRRVSMVRHEANRTVADQVRRNQQDNVVLQIPIVEGGMVRKVVPAFPIDVNEYQKWGLAFIFVERHRAATRAALRRLDATRPPTDRDIEIQTDREKGRMLEDASTRPAADANAPLGETPAVAGTVAGADDAEAKRRATDLMIHRRATQGRIYVDNAVQQEITFPVGAGETEPNEIALWTKQYKLWIAEDVVAAVKATNDAVLNGLPREDQNVLNAAVKRWTDLRVADDYFVRETTERAAGQPTYSPYRTGVPTPGGMETEFGPGRPGMPGRPEMPGRPGMPGQQPGAGTERQTDTSVTQHYTRPESDVIHYSFSVVMPNRYLLLLINTLQAGRLHAVMEVSFGPLPNGETDKLYYYGNDPVLLVTLSCEAQLLTSWSRDLMPVGFLEKIPQSALREKDRKRIPPRSLLPGR